MALGFPAFGRMFELHRSVGVSQRVSDLAVSIRCCWLFSASPVAQWYAPREARGYRPEVSWLGPL